MTNQQILEKANTKRGPFYEVRVSSDDHSRVFCKVADKPISMDELVQLALAHYASKYKDKPKKVEIWL